MHWLTILIIALGLAMDAFAVSIAVGSRLRSLSFRPLFRLSFHFGLFQFMMPVIGWYLGSRIEHLMKDYDHWIAFGLLFIIGAKMIYESIAKSDDDKRLNDPTRKWSLIILSVATSIDALAVGLSIALLGIEVWSASIIIGIVACVMTAIGMVFGRKLGAIFGKRMEFIGGIILIGIGIKIVIEHTM
ncbi:MAG: manganese efflux pump [candidate division Zixibacteria bacterium]|nr:manganese efflux pump [candidate division Zixibacteria bacterium]